MTTPQTRDSARVDTAVLERPLANVIDARWAKPLAEELDLHTVGDLLRHYPRRYTKRGELTPISRLEVGEAVTLVAKVAKVNARVVPKNGRRLQILTLTVGDGTQSVECTFFNQNFLARAFPVGSEGIFSGKVKRFNRTLQLDAPQAASLDGYLDEDGKVEKIQSFAGIYPIYGVAGKLKLKSVQDAVAAVLTTLGTVPDPVPPQLLARHSLVDLTAALTSIHQPAGDRDIERARDRLRYDEALSMQLVLAQRRSRARSLPGRAVPAHRRRAAVRLRRAAAVRVDGRSGRGRGDDRRRPRDPAPDEQAAAGGGGLGQDDRRAAGDAAGGGRGSADGTARTDRGAGRPARPLPDRDARPAGHRRRARRPGERHPGHPADRLAVGAGPATGVAGHRVRVRRDRRRHPRTARPSGDVRRPGPGRRRRTAPLRGRAA